MRELLAFKTFVSTNIVLEFPNQINLDDHIEHIGAGVFRDFPKERMPTGVPSTAPPQIPRFLFVSHGSRLELGPVQLKYSIEYQSNAQRSYPICDQVIRTRLRRIFSTFIPDVVQHFSFAGTVNNVILSYSGTDRQNPALDLASKFLRVDVGQQQIQDAEFRIGVRHEDMYFINITCTNHELMQADIQTPPSAVPRVILVPHHQMDTVDSGITIIADVNTKLFNRINHRFPQINFDEFSRLLDLMRSVMEQKIDSLILEARI